MKNYWLVKTEPESYGWDDLVKEGNACWDGVRNYAARKHMMGMQIGDEVLVYHSGKDKAVIGIAKVVKEQYSDPTTDDERWIAVDLTAVTKFEKSISLAAIKANKLLQELMLVRQGRLSVMPIPSESWAVICAMAKK